MSAFSAAEIDRQLPAGAEIFLDHVGHFVRDPQAASAALARAGFAPTPPSIQVDPDAAGGPRPTGTGNVTAMLSRGYLEVLFKTADTALGRELDAALARHAGVHLAAFAIADAAPAHARLAAVGFAMRPLVRMQRPVETAAGPDTAGFSIVRVAPDAMPEGRIQMLTHHTERAVWQPRWLGHPNGALALIDVVFAVADVAAAAARFALFTGCPAVPAAFGHTIRLDRGGVVLMPPRALAEMLPEVAIPPPPFAGAYGIAVRSLTDAERVLRAGGLTGRRDGACLVAPWPAALGLGAWLFVEHADALPWRRA
jgi:hypothetical protein